jgi:hypothetical protein
MFYPMVAIPTGGTYGCVGMYGPGVPRSSYFLLALPFNPFVGPRLLVRVRLRASPPPPLRQLCKRVCVSPWQV